MLSACHIAIVWDCRTVPLYTMVASFAQNVRLAVKTLEDVAVGTFALFMMMIQQSPLIGMLFLISSAWILVRYAVIAIIPTLMYMSTAFDIYLNMIIAVIDAVILAIKGTNMQPPATCLT